MVLLRAFNRDKGILDIGFHYNWPFVSISTTGKYFEKGDGTVIIPIGISPIEGIVENPHVPPDPNNLKDYLAYLKSKGINTLRFYLETPWSGCWVLESPLGIYHPEYAKDLDTFFDILDEVGGMYVTICPWNTAAISITWNDNFNIWNIANQSTYPTACCSSFK